MYSNVKSLAQRMAWSSELCSDAPFQMLLWTLKSRVLDAQVQLMQTGSLKGFDARGISNLVWAIVKLEIPIENSGDVGYELLQNLSPLVLFFLPSSSSQVITFSVCDQG